MGFLTVLTLIFIVLKLTNFIEWHWLVVFAPVIVQGIAWIVLTIWWESKTPLEKAQWAYKQKRG